ncbi:MAG: hypothetical protein U9M91_01580 [Chloroflexota bacterium]|nr:hypothetical protein [Chloroflexota bacterium]
MPIDTRDWYREDYERKQKQERPPFKRVDHRKYYEDGKHCGGGRKMPKALKTLLTVIVVMGALFCFFWFTGCLGWLADGTLPVWLEARLDGISVPGGYGMANRIGAKNPTYDELVDFIRKDQTDKTPYELYKYSCLDYARDIHNNAETAGIRAGLVILNQDSESVLGGHALNVFDTTDKGLIFVDCTSYDMRAYVTVGEIYSLDPLYSGAIDDNMFVWTMVGTVEDYRIYWW